MLLNLPVARYVSVRTFFFASVLITAALLFWIIFLRNTSFGAGLTPIFFILFIFQDYTAAMFMLFVLLVALFFPASPRLRLLARWIGDHQWLTAAASAIVMAVGANVVYQAHPLAMDEYSPLFQSKAFAAGRLSGEFPPSLLDWLIPRGFQNYFLNVSRSDGQVVSAYLPSFALLLTPFTFLGIPWACNPVLAGATVLAAHRLAQRLFNDKEAAGMAALLTAASPVIFANGISYYSMSAHLLTNTVFLLLLLQPTPRRLLAAGVVGSVALTLHNPMPHALFAAPWIIWLLTREGGLKSMGWLALGYLPLTLLLGAGWYWYSTGLVGASENAIERYSPFAVPTWNLLYARLIGLSKMWLWAVPGLLLLAGFGAWRWRHDSRFVALLASALLTFVGFLFVTFDQGHGWGFRYFHPAWIALPILAVGALWRPAGSTPAPREDEGPLRGFVVACALLSLLGGVGLRAVQMGGFMSDHLSQQPAGASDQPRVMIIDYANSFYGQDLIQNDPLLRGDVIRMVSHGPKMNAAMMREHFPDYRRVNADRNGEVWSRLPNAPASVAPDSSARRSR